MFFEQESPANSSRLSSPTLNVTIDGAPLYRRLEGPDIAKRKLLRLFTEQECLYIIPSPGLGYGLVDIDDADLPAGSSLLVLELHSELRAFFSGREDNPLARTAQDGWTAFRAKQVNSAIHISNADTVALVAAQVEAMLGSSSRIRRVRLIQPVRLSAPVRATAGHILSSAEAAVRRMWRNHSTLIFMSRLWVSNLFRNCSSRHRSPALKHENSDAQLAARLPSGPLIVCGAGTSLDDAAPLILDAQAQGLDPLVLAADTAVPVLIEQGIVPHIVVALEAQFWNLDDFVVSGALENMNRNGTLLFHDLTAFPASVRSFRNRRAFVSRFGDTRLLEVLQSEYPVIPALGSVGVAALYIAAIFFDRKIWYCGTDFAYPRGRSHGRMAAHHQRALRLGNRLGGIGGWAAPSASHITLESTTGKILSDPVMEDYHQLFEDVAAAFPGRIFCLASCRRQADGSLLRSAVDGAGGGVKDAARGGAEMVVRGDVAAQTIPGWEELRAALPNELASVNRCVRSLLASHPLQGSPDGGPDLSTDARRLWMEAEEILIRRDFLWKFLPGRKIPGYNRGFIHELLPQLAYWQRYFARLGSV